MGSEMCIRDRGGDIICIDQKSGLAARALDGEETPVGVEVTMQVGALMVLLTVALETRGEL